MYHCERHMLEEIHNHTFWEAYVDWIPDDFYEGKSMYAVLAAAICSCMSYSQIWSDSMMTDVLDKMFTVPDTWLRENVAGFLLFCSETLILTYIGDLINTADDEKLNKAARLVTDMIIMSYRFDNQLSNKRGIGKVFEKVRNSVYTPISSVFLLVPF